MLIRKIQKNKACPVKLRERRRGFSLIEMMVAISIVLLLVTFGIGALLNVMTVSKKSQAMRSALDSLSFTIDQMSQDLRSGINDSCTYPYNDYCKSDKFSFFTPLGEESTYEIKFGGIYKNNILLTDSLITINPNSSFTLNGPEGNIFITINLFGNIINKNDSAPFAIQTSIFQRIGTQNVQYQEN